MKRYSFLLLTFFAVLAFSCTTHADLINVTFSRDNFMSPDFPVEVVLLNNRTGAPITGLTKANFKLLRTTPKAINITYSVTPVTSTPGAYIISVTGTFECGAYGSGGTYILFYIRNNPHYGAFEYLLECED